MTQSHFHLLMRGEPYFHCYVCHKPILGDVWCHERLKSLYCTHCKDAVIAEESKPAPPPPTTDVHIYPTKPKVYCLDCEHCCLYWRLGDPDSYKHISLGEEEYIQKRLAGARCRAVCAEEQGPMYHWSVPAKCIEVNAHNDCTKFERCEEKAEKVR